jgi:nucleoside 2-deoxyribosyltransferase
MRVYLAGPEVFLPEAAEIGREKRTICARYGLIGLFPLDNELAPPKGKALSTAIYRGNLDMLRRCDAIIANLTPFRGVSADPGTAFELGYADALGKARFGYSNTGLDLRERVSRVFGSVRRIDDRVFASDNLSVENFGLFDNLMLCESIGSGMVLPNYEPGAPNRDLTTFESCVRIAARALGTW